MFDIYDPEFDCPEPNGAKLSMAIYTFYVVFLNILLVNLLIAIFS